MLVPESSGVCMPSFTLVALRVCSIKLRFLSYFGLIQTHKGVWPYRHSYNSPLVTLILNFYRFVNVTI